MTEQAERPPPFLGHTVFAVKEDYQLASIKREETADQSSDDCFGNRNNFIPNCTYYQQYPYGQYFSEPQPPAPISLVKADAPAEYWTPPDETDKQPQPLTAEDVPAATEVEENDDADDDVGVECPKCGDKFGRWSPFASHSHTAHGCEPTVKCTCGEAISKSYVYAKHTKNHRKTPGVCKTGDDCGKARSNPDERASQSLCHICNKVFTSRGGLYVHIRMQHKLLPDEKSNMCDLCGKVFCTKGNLKVHLETIHHGQKDFCCDICGKSFARSNFLKKHKTSHLQPSVPCTLCPLMFKTKDRLRRHLRSHSDARPYVCVTCGKRFKTSVVLKHHNYLHTGEVPYSCPYCDKCFRNNGNLAKHKKRIHKKEASCRRAADSASQHCQT